jgi:hypothetical protein
MGIGKRQKAKFEDPDRSVGDRREQRECVRDSEVRIRLKK